MFFSNRILISVIEIQIEFFRHPCHGIMIFNKQGDDANASIEYSILKERAKSVMLLSMKQY